MAAKKTDWVVTTSGERPAAAVAKDLKKKGLEVDFVLDAIGQITGAGPADLAPKLRAVKGVVDVSENVGADVGPPDADIS